MRYIVTGGAGFIGSHIVDSLIQDKHSVLVIDNLSTGDKAFVNEKAKFIEGDVCNITKLTASNRKWDGIYHTAAQARIQPSVHNPRKTFEANMVGTFELLEFARKYKIKNIVFSSSSSVYGNTKKPYNEKAECRPLHTYGVTKLSCEHYFRVYAELYGLQPVILRYFNVYGSRMTEEGENETLVAIFYRQKRNNVPLTIVGDGEQRRDFTHVSDVVSANKAAMMKAEELYEKHKMIAPIFNVGTGENYSVNEIADLVGGKKRDIGDRPAEVKETLADSSKARSYLNWFPRVSIKMGLAMYERELNQKYGIKT